MKKILFLLLCTVTMYGQTYQNPTYGTLTLKTNVETTTANKIPAQETSGLINWLQPINIPIPITPANYSITAPTLGAHLIGIDNKFASVTATTAGISTRVWFTADVSVVSATNYYATNATSKGTLASAIQSVTNDDNQKKYYTQDLIGAPFATATLFPPGTYAGNLSASTTPNSAQQRWTVELYKCDNGGTPIASGVTGAVVGSLGVTVITILDSGLLTLADGSVTNVQVSGTLPSGGLSMAVGQRIRYHVSAEKVGTAASNITQSVYYGTSYNSFIDVPVPLNTSGVQNLSNVVGSTTTDALNTLNSSIPVNYTKIVYVNATDPNSATIFDVINPPVTNDNALKAVVTNLYVATDASGWVYNSTSLTYVTKSSPSVSSTFYNSGTTIPASNTTAPVYRTGDLAVGTTIPRATMHSYATTASNRILFLAESDLTPTSGVTFRQGIGLTRSAMEGVNPGYALFGYNVNAQSSTSITSAVAASSDTGNVPLILMQGQRWIDAGGTPSSAITRPIFGVSNYGTRLMTMLVDGKTGFGASSPVGKVDIVTGNAPLGSLTTQANGSVSFGNTTATTMVQPTITGKSNTSPGQGLRFVGASNNNTTLPVMQFDVRVNTDLDFSTLTTSAFKFTRFETTSLFEILRNGNIIVPTTPTTSAGTYDFVTRNTSTGVLEKVSSASVAPIDSPIFTSDPKAPTAPAGDNDLTIANTAYVTTTTTPKITITTAVSITTATTDAGSLGQNGRHVVIDNGASVINLTCNGGVTTSYGKAGTGAITFVQGSGRTLVQLDGTAVLNGIAGSRAILWSNGTIDYLSVINY